jgi:hypothetical protein
MSNAFLNEFIKMRRNLVSPNIINDATNKNKKVEIIPKKKYTDITLATIIEKKPSSKVVLKYFKNKIDEIEV